MRIFLIQKIIKIIKRLNIYIIKEVGKAFQKIKIIISQLFYIIYLIYIYEYQ